MGKILTRIKSWWITMTPTEKLHVILHGIVAGAAIGGSVYCAREYHRTLDKMDIELKLVTEPSIKENDPEQEDKKKPEKTYSPYDDASALLHTLWKNDDILFSDDCYDAFEQADHLLTNMDHPAKEIEDILNRADENGDLDQEDLFKVQGAAEDLARYLAIREDREETFKKEFPWLNRSEEKKEEE